MSAWAAAAGSSLEVPLASLLGGGGAAALTHPLYVVEDFLLRRLCEVEGLAVLQTIKPGQFVLSRSCISVSATTGVVSLRLLEALLHPPGLDEAKLIEAWAQSCRTNKRLLEATAAAVCDAATVRQWLLDNGGVAFIANGSQLARNGDAADPDAPLGEGRGIPFASPATLQREVPLGAGRSVQGLVIPQGVTVITGGGFHGKSTLLRALSLGAYDKIPGDGRELCVTAGRAVSIRSEDGRCVNCVDISPFISNLPASCGFNVSAFSTSSASGSTSQASSVIEGIEMGCSLFLLDEDTCAGNFMIRDSRMRSLIANEPITPYIYRVNSLHKQLGISTLVVIGGSGDWFDVQDTTLQLDDYACLDVSRRVLQISKTFCTGRVEYNGRGLVHQLPWTHTDTAERRFDASQLAIGPGGAASAAAAGGGGGGGGGGVRASEDGQQLYYGPRLVLDLSKLEQKLPTIEGRAGALGIAAALAWIGSSSWGGQVTLAEVLERYCQQTGVGATPGLQEALGSDTYYVLPLPAVLAAAINRLRGLRWSVVVK